MLSKQATNFSAICRGESITSVERALRIQNPRIVQELKEHYKAVDNRHLATILVRV